MLIASIFFWEETAVTFQIHSGTIMPTLFDMAVIMPLSPLREVFDLTLETNQEFNFNNPSFEQYITDHQNKVNEEDFEIERVAFLPLGFLLSAFAQALCK